VTDGQILATIGRNIRSARLKASLTQECLAELAGIHSKTFGRIERGQFSYSATILVRIIRYLRVDPNELLRGLPPPDAGRIQRITKALARRRKPTKRLLKSAGT
jgi:transcriptional regulator with XRE-family HTH domain